MPRGGCLTGSAGRGGLGNFFSYKIFVSAMFSLLFLATLIVLVRHPDVEIRTEEIGNLGIGRDEGAEEEAPFDEFEQRVSSSSSETADDAEAEAEERIRSFDSKNSSASSSSSSSSSSCGVIGPLQRREKWEIEIWVLKINQRGKEKILFRLFEENKREEKKIRDWWWC